MQNFGGNNRFFVKKIRNFLQKFEKIVFYTIFLDDYRAAHACMKRNYERLKMQGVALFQKKSLNLHMPGRTRKYLRRIPCSRANKGVPKYEKKLIYANFFE